MNLDDIAKMSAVIAVGTAIVLTNFSKEIIQSIEPYLIAKKQASYESNQGEIK